MISKELQNIINSIILKKYPELESIWLYGSYAKGKATEQSDIDICVKMPEGTNVMRHDLKLNWELLNATEKAVHVVFCTQKNEWMLEEIYNNKNILV